MKNSNKKKIKHRKENIFVSNRIKVFKPFLSQKFVQIVEQMERTREKSLVEMIASHTREREQIKSGSPPCE